MGRSLLPPSANTPSGSVAPSWLPSPPSSRCGSPRPSTTSPAPPSSTASASKLRMRNFPADVDLQGRVRRVRPLHRPPQVLLSCACATFPHSRRHRRLPPVASTSRHLVENLRLFNQKQKKTNPETV